MKKKAKKKAIVPAEIHSDDHRRKANFDAAPWFEQASDDEIIGLAEIEWSGDEAADYVAEHFQGSDANVDKVYTHLEVSDGGFEVSVDGDASLRWIEANRPQLVPKLREALGYDPYEHL